jgi:hypothetical protein
MAQDASVSASSRPSGGTRMRLRLRRAGAVTGAGEVTGAGADAAAGADAVAAVDAVG